jgi:hypothetical protein
LIRKVAVRAVVVVSVVGAFLAPCARGAVLEHYSVGPTGGSGNFSSIFEGASADGTRVFFRTDEQLVSGDTDTFFDLYERSGGVTTLLSTGPNGGNGMFTPFFRGISADGSHVFFETSEQLVAADADGNCYDQQETVVPCYDVYDRSNGTTTLISTGPNGATGNFNARFRGASADGSRVFFTTKEQLVPADTDNAQDVYMRSGGTTTLLSTGPAGGNGDFDAQYRGSSADGAHVFIQTSERLTSSDTDSSADIYDVSGGTTTLVSTGASGGNGANDAAYAGSSSDGSRIFFETDEQLTPADTDSSVDVYQRAGGVTSLVSTGPAGGNGTPGASYVGSSKDGAKVWFETKESLVTGDTDTRQDVYERSGGTTSLVSTGPSGGSGPFDASFEGASDDGSRIWIGTFEQLTPTDTDSAFDIFERSGGTTTQVSIGPSGGNANADAFFDGASADGSHVWFDTFESLVPGDTDSYVDVYQRYQGATTLITTQPSGPSATYAQWVGASADGSRVFFTSGDKLLSDDTDTQTDVYGSVDVGTYARPKGATPLVVPLVIAFRDCTSPNRVHGAPLAYPSCAPPVQASNFLTIGTADSNGAPTKSIGSVRLDTTVGDPSTPADEADLQLKTSVTDVRNKSDLSDYGGELQTAISMRITDKLNGSVPVDPGTVQDIPFSYTVPCSPTSDTTVGSTCAVATTADSLVPGTITEGKRAIWEVGQVQLYDGGADSVASTTADNTLFETQGVFVP